VWLATAPVLAILAFAGLIRSTGGVGATLLLARGRPEPALWWNFGFGVFICGWISIWLHFSPTAISAAWAQLTAVLATFWVWHGLISKFGQVNYRPILRFFGHSFLWFGGCFLMIFLLKNTIFQSNYGEIVTVSIFIGAYFFYLKMNGFLREILRLIRR
jgi:O-antigen/teichoic acid export membrane protein